MLWVLIIGFFVLMGIGVPIAFSMGLSGIVAIFIDGNIPRVIVPQRIFVAMDSFTLMAIPFFILAGELMNTGGITKRIVKFSSSLIGHIRGGLAHVNILASMFFAGISGSAVADASSIGAMLIPAMVEDGYDDDFSVAVTATSSCIGPIIPPSIGMIVYASMSGLSIGSLFMGGMIPGILMGLVLIMVTYVFAVKRGYKAEPKASLNQIWASFKGAISALLMPLIILGGILSGVFTATEAGAIAVLYGFIVGFLTKQLKVSDLPRIIMNAAVVTTTTMMVIGAAQVMSWLLARQMFPQLITTALTTLTQSPIIVLILILVVLFILGFFMDATALLIILVPVLVPIANQFGFDPIHFAVLVVMTVQIGAVTPPVGILLFITCNIGKIPVSKGAKAVAPFLAAMIAVVLLCLFIPGIITWIPSFFAS
ncbi:TRAP transporter large permease [Alkalibacter saccharofermentans]|uniref:C4-dicarboxylate transporter, DctM subunit n=1 Tax=Alkalibacter saccharofermentans DSM 14828 TaxID=1120975 RepID=A0A1M5A6V1_9FIRM|nr:TRAP transporter large permease [Alkalibacter saccharofermentans]SHF25885.1 C4-dicarboxylate transporter, DctM subunit [Alkalibacter saccharofermentans DSM 14828]